MCNFNLTYIFGLTTEIAGFPSFAEVFCKSRDSSAAADLYSTYISQQLSEYSVSSNIEHIAALIIEPGKYIVLHQPSELLGYSLFDICLDLY